MSMSCRRVTVGRKRRRKGRRGEMMRREVIVRQIVRLMERKEELERARKKEQARARRKAPRYSLRWSVSVST